MRRPGPLQEWPLEKFLPRDPNIPNPIPLKKNNKRPLSPTTPSHYSPAKRRILNDEGVFSLEKTFKSPLSSLRSGLASPARFGHVLAGSASPARILDFGLPESHRGDPRKPQRNLSSEITPVAPSLSSEPLAPSPELKLRSATHATTRVRVDQPLFNNNSHHLPSQLPLTTRDTAITTLARELPLASDPQSIHYPGFSVYQDPHLYIYPHQPLGKSSDASESDRDAAKENLPPRRKVRKSVSAPDADARASCDVGLSMKRPKSTTYSPKPMQKHDGFALSPRPTANSNQSSKRSRSELRQMMENELDIDEEADDIYD